MTSDKQKEFAKLERVSLKLVEEVAELQRLPVVTFVAGGIATPADAALLMQLGAEGVFVGSGIFKSKDPAKVAEAIVQATVHFQDSAKLAEVSTGLGELMPGLEISALESRMQERGW
jgi:pyridoxal 5'-phosphate synthase pdxS subunit